MLIAFDFDDVVADSARILRTLLKRDYDFDLYSLREYKIYIPGIKEYICNFIVNFSSVIPPTKGAINILKLLEKNQIPIIFLTARKKELNDITGKWIQRNIGIENFSIINKYTPEEKVNYLKFARIPYLVEDRFLTVKLASELDIIKKIFLINKNWNIGREVKNPKVVRLNSLTELTYFFNF